MRNQKVHVSERSNRESKPSTVTCDDVYESYTLRISCICNSASDAYDGYVEL
jgi:hypothetical protein